MGLARRITRGGGERTAIKELRNSQYPQLSLKAANLPTPERISFDNNIQVCRIESFDQPTRLANRINLINSFKRADKGNGIQLTYPIQSSFSQVMDSPTISNYGRTKITQNSLTSYNINYSLIQFTFNSVTSFIGINPRFNVGISMDVNANFNQYSYSGVNVLEPSLRTLLNGGVLSARTFVKTDITHSVVFNLNNKSTNRLTQIRTAASSVFLNSVTDTNSSSLNGLLLQGAGVFRGGLQYFNTNTNQHRNAQWLLNQRTQY